MNPAAPTPEAIQQLANAIFAKSGVFVSEAYSAFDCLPIDFRTATELADYMSKTLSKPKAPLDVAVHYPDMGGRPILERIDLDRHAVPGHTHRYTWGGWGLIHVQLSDSSTFQSRVVSNSLARATKWSETIQDMGDVESWDWVAIQRHTRRLQRVLNKVA